MIEQAEALINHTHDQKLPCKIVMHDNDGKYSKPFLEVFKRAKIKPHRTAIRSPNTVAFVERFVQTIQQECSHAIGLVAIDYSRRKQGQEIDDFTRT